MVGEVRSPDKPLAGDSIAVLAGDEDAEAVAALLEGGDLAVARVGFDDICSRIEDGTLAIGLIAAELLSPDSLAQLRHSLANQPRWSDAPILLLADRGHLDDIREILDFGQLRIVERPLHPLIFGRAIRSASGSRTSQRAGAARQIADLKALSERLAREVEEHTRTEELLRESEQLYRYTVELSQQIVWTADADGSNTVVGGNFYSLTGQPDGKPFAECIVELMHPDDYDRLLAGWRAALNGGNAHRQEFRMRVADGSYHDFEGRAAPRRDEDGAIIRWYGFVEDVTERHQATEALQEAEERYRLAARATNDAVWDWNIPTGKVAWSDAAAAYLGTLPPEDSTIDWWEQAIHPDDRDRVVRSLHATLKSDKTRWSAAYRMTKADGDFAYVYDRGFIIRNDDGEAVRAVGAVVDLTERRRADAELRRTQAELIHVSRVSAMGTMASTLAHELNQPLTAVTSYVRGSRRLLASMDDPAVQQVCEALEFAEAGALRAGQIVRRLRELVSRGAVSVGPEDLGRLIEDASVLAFLDEHLYGISHRIEVDPDARWVEVDRIQIQQVLINLIRNSIQALQHAERREVVIRVRGAGEDMVEVSVADTGVGIEEQVRDALFSPFHSTKVEGMGIGLSISRTIVEAHHGKIWSEDAQGGGTVFRFTLPRAEIPTQDLIDAAAGDEGRHSSV